jgi:hypothetical protein
MREVERIGRILNTIRDIWIQQPDTRFLQLITNMTWDYSSKNNDCLKEFTYSKWETPDGTIVFKKDMANVDGFYVEDTELEEFLKDYLK